MKSNIKYDFTQRNEAIDILRALTVLLMIFVNDFWSVRGVPGWMKHAAWGEDFLGLADVVYPVFLFVVGMSIPLAIENRYRKGFSERSIVLHFFSRTLALLIMGAFTEQSLSRLAPGVPIAMPLFKVLMVVGFFLIWNTYPRTDKPVRHLYSGLQIAGVILLVWLAFIFRDIRTVNNEEVIGYFRGNYGILGGIGWSYLVCAFVYFFIRNNIPNLSLIWLGFFLFTIARSSPPQWIPRQPHIINDLMGIARIGSTTVLTLGGVLFSLLIVKYSQLAVRKMVIYLITLIGVVLIAAVVSHQFWIVSKLGATPTWVLYCTAIIIGTYGLLHWAVAKGKAKWFNIIKAGGTATLSCYVMPYLLQSVFHRYVPILTQDNYYKFIDFILPQSMQTDMAYMYSGLIKCFVWALLCIWLTALLERYKIKLKI